MFKEVRRQDRTLKDETRVIELLSTSEYGFLNLGTSTNGYAYGIPISYAYDISTNTLYFHSAIEGNKLEYIENNNKISFCVVGKTQPIGSKFTTLYESVIAFGIANLSLTDDEKRKALNLLVDKYSKGYEDKADKYIKGAWDRVFCFSLKIEHITAKAKQL